MAQLPNRELDVHAPNLFHRTRFDLPDVPCILSNGSIAGKSAGSGNVEDGLSSLRFLVDIELTQTLVRLRVAF